MQALKCFIAHIYTRQATMREIISYKEKSKAKKKRKKLSAYELFVHINHGELCLNWNWNSKLSPESWVGGLGQVLRGWWGTLVACLRGNCCQRFILNSFSSFSFCFNIRFLNIYCQPRTHTQTEREWERDRHRHRHSLGYICTVAVAVVVAHGKYFCLTFNTSTRNYFT